jgi:hypothetical protein
VGQLYFISAGDEFAGIPETSSCFTRQHISSKRNQEYGPAGKVIDFSELHMSLIFFALFQGEAKIGDFSSWSKVSVSPNR